MVEGVGTGIAEEGIAGIGKGVDNCKAVVNA